MRIDRKQLAYTLGAFVIFFIAFFLLAKNGLPDIIRLFSAEDQAVPGTIIFSDSKDKLSVAIEGEAIEVEEPQEPVRTKPEEQEIKAIYLTSATAARDSSMDYYIDLINRTELNALVIDIKDYSGRLSYLSEVPLAQELNTHRNTIKDIKGLLNKLNENGVYTIARQTVFQDPELSSKKPEWAVKDSSTGGVWHDWKGLGWLDPTQEEVWNYNIAIAREAIELGFDEINFDYIRFPSDGPTSRMVFANLDGRTRNEVIRDFFKYVREKLDDLPAYISVDLFGFTTERTDGMSIGQRITDAAPYIDYIAPMVYPSHYPSGYLNYDNPAAHPYPVIYNSISKGIAQITGVENNRAKIRPWLQSFNLGATYTPSMVRTQMEASDEVGGYGWMLWNARNVYNEGNFLAAPPQPEEEIMITEEESENSGS